MEASFFLTAGFIGILTFGSGSGLVAFSVVVWTFGEMMLFPSTASFLGEIAPTALRGR